MIAVKFLVFICCMVIIYILGKWVNDEKMDICPVKLWKLSIIDHVQVLLRSSVPTHNQCREIYCMLQWKTWTEWCRPVSRGQESRAGIKTITSPPQEVSTPSPATRSFLQLWGSQCTSAFINLALSALTLSSTASDIILSSSQGCNDFRAAESLLYHTKEQMSVPQNTSMKRSERRKGGTEGLVPFHWI